MRVALTTLGCKVNQYDSAVMERLFAERAWDRVAFDDHADAYVVNSCTVTDRADADARRFARRARRINPQARVILTGCYAQTKPAAIDELDYVDYVIGLGRLPDLLRAVEGSMTDTVAVSDLRQATEVETLGIESFSGRTRAFVKVQEGCNLFCTFCIVPVARGRSRSVSPRKVLDEILRLEGKGYREVVLTGVHLGGYGDDLSPQSDLAFLLEAIAERAPRLRVRVSSVDPPELTERFVDVLAGNDIFCRHLHVPLQSGSDSVLDRMGRKYDTGEARRNLDRVRNRIPDIGIGTDIITGFPGESPEEFESGLAWLESLELSYLHVFPYSKRSSTAAAKRWEPLSAEVVHSRARTMRKLDARLRSAFALRFVGTRQRVLLEQARDPESGMLKGYSSNYLSVVCDATESAANTIKDVEITAANDRTVTGRIIGGAIPTASTANIVSASDVDSAAPERHGA